MHGGNDGGITLRYMVYFFFPLPRLVGVVVLTGWPAGLPAAAMGLGGGVMFIDMSMLARAGGMGWPAA